MALIELHNVSKRYCSGSAEVEALSGIDLSIEAWEALAILGPSGSGKSTLMNLLGCIDVPSAGRYLLDGMDVGRMSRARLAATRNNQIGFIFQAFNLLETSTALENVQLPLVYAGVSLRKSRRHAMDMLEEVGIADRSHHRPWQLSGGQQQRVAIARALVTSPKLVLADEPTGSLDSQNGLAIIELLQAVHKRGAALVLITHDETLANRLPRQIALKDGKLDNPSRRMLDCAQLFTAVA